MMMAVMTPPVPAPTIAAMPTIAADGNVQAGVGENESGEGRESRAKRRAEIERGRKDAARSAAAEADRRRQQLEHEQQNQEAGRRHALVEDRLDDAIADAVDIGMAESVREADHHQADQRHADDVLRVDVARQLGEAVLHEHEKPDEGPGGDAA